MKKLLTLSAAALTLAAAASPEGNAAVLTQYTFSNTLTSSNNAANVSATDPVTLTSSSATIAYNSSNGPDAPSLQLNPLSENDFIQFGLTTTSPTRLDDVTFVLENSGNGPTNFIASYRLGSTGAFTAIESFTVPTPGFFTRVADDSFTATPVTFSGDVDFRLTFGTPANPTATTRRVRIDTITVNGTVPEPASLALVGLGTLLIASRRRSR